MRLPFSTRCYRKPTNAEDDDIAHRELIKHICKTSIGSNVTSWRSLADKLSGSEGENGQWFQRLRRVVGITAAAATARHAIASPAAASAFYGETAPHSKVDSSRDFILLMAAIRAVFLLIHEARSSPVQSSIAKY